MVGKDHDPGELVTAIRDGTFPTSEKVLSSDLSPSKISEILQEISATREALNAEVRSASGSLGDGVDQWIEKAKLVQADIERCKEEARNIVEEHTRVEAQRQAAQELEQKAGLLQSEIDFTVKLQAELSSIVSISQSLNRAQELLDTNAAPQAAKEILNIRKVIPQIRGQQVQRIVQSCEDELSQKVKHQLEHTLDERIIIHRNTSAIAVEIQSDVSALSLENAYASLNELGSAKESLQSLASKLEAPTLLPLRRRSKFRASRHVIDGDEFTVNVGDNLPSVSHQVKYIVDFWDFLRQRLPAVLVHVLAAHLMPHVVSTFVSDCLVPDIPIQFNDLDRLDQLQQNASELATYLESNGWNGAMELSAFIEQAPHAWLRKRKAESLDNVRKVYSMTTGSLQKVERTERKRTKTTSSKNETTSLDDDWNTSWDQDKPLDSQQDDVDGEADGWGFDAEDEPPSPAKTRNDNPAQESNEGEADAWGWGDEDQQPTGTPVRKPQATTNVNGDQRQVEEPEEIVLTELYSITDIPDHLLNVISLDISDSITLSEQQHPSISSISPSRELLTFPRYALAMYRATASTHYTTTSHLGNMNLYNDSSYIAEKLRSMNAPSDMPDTSQDCVAMERFARSAYAHEMETQRTIFTDLLDGAQGFEGCTQPLYAREIDNAVSSTVDRVREVHRQWKPILSTSALLQSIGSLVSTVISKIINDIEEMDEISAPQSEKLVSYCGHIAALEDLFLAKAPGVAGTADEANAEMEVESVPMTAVYVSNWLKFQYLINILDSSLVDIKYLWEQGEMSLEMDAEEVVDLIQALFQESMHRRSAINAIRGNRRSR